MRPEFRMGCPGIRRLILDIEDYLYVTISVGNYLKGSLLGLDDLFLEAVRCGPNRYLRCGICQLRALKIE